MGRLLTLTLSLFAALAIVAVGGAPPPAHARVGAQEKRAPAKGRASGKKSPPKIVAEKPQVREIDEAGLKAILDESAKNGRRLLINFWATWCIPCREEFPDLVRVDEEFGGQNDFEFITVSLDDISEIEQGVPAFLSEMRATKMPAYLLNANDPEAVITLVDQTWRGDLPATFLFGRKGEILFRHMGRVKADELRKAINASASSAAPATDVK